VAQLEVWRERRFAIVIEKELLSGAFDRVVIGLSAEGRPLAAEIIDFKTDAVTTEEEKKKRSQEYASQLEAYCEALKKMLPEVTIIETKLVWSESAILDII
jgi:ATP-dependent exoDNAse (exonuclease V) beta subunit